MRTERTATASQIPRPVPHSRTAIIPKTECAKETFGLLNVKLQEKDYVECE